ncbi:hypothetical protein ABZ345_43130 [Lentzea sp. NPDC005914]
MDPEDAGTSGAAGRGSGGKASAADLAPGHVVSAAVVPGFALSCE